MSRLSKSENVGHHKQLLLEQYKSRLTDYQSKASLLDKKLILQKASIRNNNLQEIKALEENLAQTKRNEKELKDQLDKVTYEKNNLEAELDLKDVFIKDQVRTM